MLSQKIQDDLMSAYQQVHEAKRGHAAGDSDVEKQASQLASDVRYKAKGKVKEGASEEEKKKIFMQILGASPAPTAVKSMAKQKLLGEAKEEGSMISNVSKSLIRNQRRFGDTGSTEPTGRTGQGMSSAAKMSLERQKETKEKRGVKTTGPQAQTQTEERFPDGKEGTKKRLKALEKKRGMKMPNHPQFKTEEKAPRMQKGAMAYDGPNKPASEAKDRLLMKTKKKREKMQMNSYKPEGELVDEMAAPAEKKPKEKKMTRSLLDSIRKVNTGAGSQYEAMDPVGKEDKDVDNDGDHDSTDKYLLNRRKAIGKAIAKKRGKVKEGFSAWRIDLDFNEQVKK